GSAHAPFALVSATATAALASHLVLAIPVPRRPPQSSLAALFLQRRASVIPSVAARPAGLLAPRSHRLVVRTNRIARTVGQIGAGRAGLPLAALGLLAALAALAALFLALGRPVHLGVEVAERRIGHRRAGQGRRRLRRRLGQARQADRNSDRGDDT